MGRLLKGQGFSLQASAKTLEGKQHPDRDAQFRYINEQVKEHQSDGQPVISIDAKKKEQVGQLPNPGGNGVPPAIRCRWRTTASTSSAPTSTYLSIESMDSLCPDSATCLPGTAE